MHNATIVINIVVITMNLVANVQWVIVAYMLNLPPALHYICLFCKDKINETCNKATIYIRYMPIITYIH